MAVTSDLSILLLTVVGEAQRLPLLTSQQSAPLLAATGAGTPGFVCSSVADIPLAEVYANVNPLVQILTPEVHGQAMAGAVASSEVAVELLEAHSQAATSTRLTSRTEVIALEAAGIVRPSRTASSLGTAFTLDATASALTQRLAASQQVAPVLDAAGLVTPFGLATSAADVLALQVEGHAITSRIASSAQTLPVFEVVGQSSVMASGWSAQALPMLEAVGAGITGRVGTSTLTLPSVQVSGQGQLSATAASQLELPVLDAAGFLALGRVGTSILVMPALVVQAQATNNAPAPTAGTAALLGKTYAMQTQNATLTEYRNHGFNSYAVHGSVVLAANKDGLFVLGGATDNGQAIASLVQLELSDLDDAHVKRVSNMVMGYRSDGTLSVSVTTDDGDTFKYPMLNVDGSDCKPNRVKIGRGMRSRYWTVKVESVADFALDKLDMDFEVMARRVY